jgi:hypothetical protein
MSRNAPAVSPVSNSWEERRRLPRKRTLLLAVIADANGENASDCTIQDVNAGGAQINFPETLAIGSEIYLLDTGSQLAYMAKVMWSKSGRSGLSFLQTHPLGSGLPAHLTFLWRLYLEAKLGEIDRALDRGVPAGLAFLNAGLSEVDLHFMSQRASGDMEFESALVHAKRLLSFAASQSEI